VATKKSFEDGVQFVSMVAEHQGWILNRNLPFVHSLIEGLNTNYNRYGYFLCPCRDTDDSREKDKDIICPCDYAKPDIEEYGHCYCALYFSPDFYMKKNKVRQIPERRPE
jgi:ferredoxin-thioredoxin reductase catalytic subunit